MSARIDEVAATSKQVADALKSIKRRLANMAVLIKNITTHQKTKPIYEAYKKAKNKEQFRAAHESDLILYETEAKALRAAPIGGKLTKQVKEYDTMKRNIDSILKIERGQAKKKITAIE